MSGLEKFEGTEAWFARFKSFLLKDRSVHKEEKESVNVVKSQEEEDEDEDSCVVDLNEDLRLILESHKEKKQKQKQSEERNEMSEDKENQLPSKLHQSNVDHRFIADSKKDYSFAATSYKSLKSSSTAQQHHSSHNDSTMNEDSSFWRCSTDESFEQLEKMCNKTLSDPNSTLSQYVKKMHQRRIEMNKEDDEETKTLNRLLKEFNFQGKLADQTQLNGVEPPSFLLENTLCLDMTQNCGISPTKMVGLNRPSTILEESGDDYSRASNDSSFVSFKTSKTGKSTDYTYETCATTDQFDTADEDYLKRPLTKETESDCNFVKNISYSSTDSRDAEKANMNSSAGTGKYQPSPDDISLNVSARDPEEDRFSNVSSKNEITDGYKRENARNFETGNTTSQDSFAESNSDKLYQEKSSDTHSSMADSVGKCMPTEDLIPYRKRVFHTDFMDLNKNQTSLSSSKSSHPISISSSFDRTKSTISNVSSICDDSLENRNRSKNYTLNITTEDSLEEKKVNSQSSQDMHNEKRQFKYFDNIPKKEHNFSGVIELSDDDDSSNNQSSTSIDNVDLNEGFSMKENEIDSSESNNSLNVSREFNDTIEEMEYIMQEGMKYMAKNGNIPKIIDSITLKYHESPRDEHAGGNSSQKSTPATVIKNKNFTYTLNSKIPIQKSIEKTKNHQQLQTTSDFKKPLFCPIRSQQQQHKTGALKKTPSPFAHIVSPVAEYIKNTPTTPLVVNMKPNNDLFKSKIVRDLEREYQLQQASHNSPAKTGMNVRDSPKIRKAIYRPAEHKHIKDERECRVIPGGDKLHRYFQPTPLIIQHEGRIKIHQEENRSRNHSIDNSLAELSVISGDVSLLTIKNAKKM